MRAACIEFCVLCRIAASMNVSAGLDMCVLSYPIRTASCSFVCRLRGCLYRNTSRSSSQTSPPLECERAKPQSHLAFELLRIRLPWPALSDAESAIVLSSHRALAKLLPCK